jgi:hypothetical protein
MKPPRMTIGTISLSQSFPKMKPPLGFPSGSSIWEQVWHLFYMPTARKAASNADSGAVRFSGVDTPG